MGLSNYSTFVHKGTFKTFVSIQQEHGLQRRDFYRYLQVRHHFNENIAETQDLEKTGVVYVFEKASHHQYVVKLYLNCTMGYAKPALTVHCISDRNGKRNVVSHCPQTSGKDYVYYSGRQHAQIHGENIVGKTFFIFIFFHHTFATTNANTKHRLLESLWKQ